MLTFLFADLLFTVGFFLFSGLLVFCAARETMAGASWLIAVTLFISTFLDWWNAPSEWAWSDLTALNYIFTQPLSLLGWIALYAVLGVAYATVKWFLYVRKNAPSSGDVAAEMESRKAMNRKEFLNHLERSEPRKRTNFVDMLPGNGRKEDENVTSIAGPTAEEIAAMMAETDEYVSYRYPYVRQDMTLDQYYMSTEYEMHPRNHYDRLVLWWFLWAPTLFWDIFDNPIKLLADFMFETFGKMFLRMSISASKKKG